MEGELFVLAAEYGGLGIISPSKISDREYHKRTVKKKMRKTALFAHKKTS